jgi:ABC-type hemin transport system substrate-binding protein
LQFSCSADDESALRTRSLPAQDLNSSVARIVSLSSLATRFVTELGVGHQIVGVDARSSALPGLSHLPIVDLESALQLAPDLVLVEELADPNDPALQNLERVGAQLVEFAPHNLEDVSALCRELGTRLVGVASATLFERKFARPLAIVGGISPARERLRVVAVIGLEPLELAGGHSFQTDLIEIAGGMSVTHGGEDVRIAMTSERWHEFSPELVLVTTSTELSRAEQETFRARIPQRFRIEFFAFDPETFWLDRPERDAERLRIIIASFSLEQSG